MSDALWFWDVTDNSERHLKELCRLLSNMSWDDACTYVRKIGRWNRALKDKEPQV